MQSAEVVSIKLPPMGFANDFSWYPGILMNTGRSRVKAVLNWTTGMNMGHLLCDQQKVQPLGS